MSRGLPTSDDADPPRQLIVLVSFSNNWSDDAHAVRRRIFADVLRTSFAVGSPVVVVARVPTELPGATRMRLVASGFGLRDPRLLRDESVVAEALATRVLEVCCGVTRSAMLFRATSEGKPLVCVSDSTIASAPGISLSHSGGMVAVAACVHGRIGVDIEAVRPISWLVADRVFAPADRQALRAIPPPGRESAFVQMWTVAEACAKGVGSGLQLLLAGFDQLGLERHGCWGAFHWSVDFVDSATACAVATDEMPTSPLCLAKMTKAELDWLLDPV